MSGRSSPPTGAILEKPQKTGAEAPVSNVLTIAQLVDCAASTCAVVAAVGINKELG